ncbi:MAG: enoyl-CoA hydratase/isomerase family protein [Betaproteobacteria bacterium]|nr:enoyl-CoA hydratase/isomerase family protein [Betaproteobacteria bacterium]
MRSDSLKSTRSHGALARAAADSDCRVLAVRGAGRFFCAGADIRIMQGGSSESERADRLADFARALQTLCGALESTPVPTIAAIRGTATGGGLELAMALAEELATQPPQALREAKRCINLARSEAGFAAEIDATRALHRHPDTARRIAAFLAGRASR